MRAPLLTDVLVLLLNQPIVLQRTTEKCSKVYDALAEPACAN